MVIFTDLPFLFERYLRVSEVKRQVFSRTTTTDRHKVRMTNQQCVCGETDTREQLWVTHTLSLKPADKCTTDQHANSLSSQHELQAHRRVSA